MIARQSGSIINMASIVGAPKAARNRCAYGMSKAAVVGLTKSVAADYVTQGIRCNAICPGTIETPSLHDRLRATGDFDGALAAFRARQPMGRRSEEHTSELQSLMRISYAVFCLKQTKIHNSNT